MSTTTKNIESITKELLETERSYVKYLDLLVRLFVQPLKLNCKNLQVSMDEVNTLFDPEIEAINQFHGLFLQEIEPLIENWNQDSKIGPVFLKMADYMKLYTTYINNFERSDKMKKNLLKRKKFKNWLDKQYTLPELNRQDLESLLIMPIQRIPRYELLLRDLLNKIDINHPDCKDLTEALNKIKNIAEHLNVMKFQSDIRRQIVSVTEKIQGIPDYLQLADGQRRLLKEGQFQACAHTEQSKSPKRVASCENNLKSFQFILFDDGLLIAKIGKKKNEYFHWMQFLGGFVEMVDIDSDLYFGNEPSNEERAIFQIDDPFVSMRCFCSIDDKTVWLELLQSLLKKFNLKQRPSLKRSANLKHLEPLVENKNLGNPDNHQECAQKEKKLLDKITQMEKDIKTLQEELDTWKTLSQETAKNGKRAGKDIVHSENSDDKANGNYIHENEESAKQKKYEDISLDYVKEVSLAQSNTKTKHEQKDHEMTDIIQKMKSEIETLSKSLEDEKTEKMKAVIAAEQKVRKDFRSWIFLTCLVFSLLNSFLFMQVC